SEQIKELREEMGLNDSIFKQYWDWISSALYGDLGNSYFMKQPVFEAIKSHIGPTVSLAIIAEIIALFISIPLGILAAIKRGTSTDQFVMVLSLAGMAVPSFLLAVFFALIVGVNLGWLPVAGYSPLSSGL